MKYRLFGRHTGLRVSELVLGTGNFGTRWGYGANPDEACSILDRYAEAGGNFIDTADGYQFGQAEEILGDALKTRRDDFVLATKYTLSAHPGAGVLATGNSRKAMVTSLEQSLKRLKTDHIDLYWAHFDDGVTPVDEIIRGFDDLVRAGKILYAGLSDFPAWRVARAATISELRGTIPIAGLQIEHSLVQRTSEYDLIPAAQALGLGIVAWSPLGGGVLTGKYRKGETGRAEGLGGNVFQPENSAQRTATIDTVIAIAAECGVSPGEVAISWVASKGNLPIIGPRTLSQLESNLAAIELQLDTQQIARLDEVSVLPPIFPYSMIHSPSLLGNISGGNREAVEQPAVPVA